ncbi:actin patch protein 1 [Aspergillus ellipticus CBS 707.79]|uniref:Actin patch protein 1 n=1 Tax=Aspergillus ellipticus CBS 707.79 TaxID=1448320 RepID=A0A319D3A3_9EURO|nr:actin patch protein 1 [Aspergillus ellipticus CBS 707.79]
MSQYESSWAPSARGTRRKKVYDYLKAANELRQTYAAQWSAQLNGGQRDYEDYHDTPGAFPDVEIARSEFEEMVIFPSYARRLVKSGQADLYNRRRGSNATIDEYRGESDGFGSTWDEVEDENAVVAVDVRGWVYAPHRGPMTRKHRLMVALARKLSGVPAPANNPSEAGGYQKTNEKGEDELVDTEAQSIIKKAEGRADSVWKDSAENRDTPGRPLQRTATDTTQLSKDEITVANAHLMERLRPFLTNPITEVPITVFFFNDGKSQSRSVITDESGHFQLRAALTFVPTHIRVLASENLSVMKEVKVVEPTGISLISDIDDTVKHSAIASGAKEMFRNTFVRELNELTVDGVTEWYGKLSKMGVDMHYVSNAPWQLYPLLERYFKLAGLPRGSFHLKQYSGMLQGIFEPTAERKRGALEQILRDFPSRKFILVGDSGEADLEVYTDIVLANPGRILGIFIRDVTTTDRRKFFERSVDHLEHDLTHSRSTPQLVDNTDTVAKRPALPPRRPSRPAGPPADTVSLDNANLIDLSDEAEQKVPLTDLKKRAPPTKPSKPSALRTVSNNPDLEKSDLSIQDSIKRKPVPPLPPRRSSTKPDMSSDQKMDWMDSYENSAAVRSTSQLPLRPRPGMQDSEGGDARPIRKQPPPPPPPRRANTSASVASSVSSQQSTSQSTQQSTQNTNRPPPQKQSYPAAAASAATSAFQYASDRLPWAPSPSNILRSTQSNSSLNRTNTNPDSSNSSDTTIPNKREELWLRRWARAQELLDKKGVILGSWRMGQDAKDVTVWLVQEAMKDIQKR